VNFIKTGYKEAGNKASNRAKGNFRDTRLPRKPQKTSPTNRKGKAGKRHIPKVKPYAAATTAERKDTGREDSVQQLALLLTKVLSKKMTFILFMFDMDTVIIIIINIIYYIFL
jgi:hypothetical protein